MYFLNVNGKRLIEAGNGKSNTLKDHNIVQGSVITLTYRVDGGS